MAITNDFKVDLAYSLGKAESTKELLLRIFPEAESVTETTDIELQREGVDYAVNFKNRAPAYIDHKSRRTDYGDDLLERYHEFDDGTKKDGWMRERQKTDYLLTTYDDTGRVSIYPWLLLWSAWTRKEKDWREKYGQVPAKNKGYTTWSIPVPPAEIKKQILEVVSP